MNPRIPLRSCLGLGLAFLVHASALAAAPPSKPKLTLKALPQVGTPSTIFVFQALLTGGPDDESLYCLSTEWVWEEQLDSSINEAECPPYVKGETKIERVFSEEQSFQGIGKHKVKVVLRKGEKEITNASAVVTVWPPNK